VVSFHARSPLVQIELLGKANVMSAELNNTDSGQRTFLVVDDFEDTRLLLRTWLNRKGFRVIEADNGKQAVTAAEEHHPDFIIMDIEMPQLDGLTATRQIRALDQIPRIPIIAVSAYGADLYRTQALEAGCDEYVSTPFEPDELERLIRSLLK
jgi:two-component system cell cycle response regulator DivK